MRNEQKAIHKMFKEYVESEAEDKGKIIGAFCEEFYFDFFRFIKARGCSNFHAHEITQDLFTKLLDVDFSNKKIKNYAQYIFSMTVNLFNDYFKLEKYHLTEDLDEEAEEVGKAVAVYDEYDMYYLEILATLDEKELIVLKLKYIHGYDLKYIARNLNVSNMTITRIIRSIKSKIRIEIRKREMLFIFIYCTLMTQLAYACYCGGFICRLI